MESKETRGQSAWKRATQEVKQIFAAFESPEKRRTVALEILADRPDDAGALRTLESLKAAEYVRKATDDGIFISYARADEVFALDLGVRLIGDGFTIWLDMIDGGEKDWTQEIIDAMQVCGLMLAVFSPPALHDPATDVEHQRFTLMGKLVLPIIHESCEVPMSPSWLPPIDFSQEYDEGMAQLRQLLLAETATA